ncbi:MAG: O-antigen ligase family protein [Sphingomicrobium sp.]
MESPHQPRSRAIGSDYAFWCAAALLFLSLIIGGGGAEAPLLNGLLEAGGALLLCACFADFLTGGPRPAAATVPLFVLFATLVLVASQLIPLPPLLWAGLPGREAAAAAYGLTAEPAAWRPLSLDPEATRRFASSLLLPAGLFLAASQMSRDRLIFMARIIVLGALISAIAAVVQRAFDLPAALYPYGSPGAGVPTGLFANPNHLAQLMVAGMVASGLILRSNSRDAVQAEPPRRRFRLGWLLIPIFMAATIATQSRAGIILMVPAALAGTMLGFGGRGLGRVFGLSIAAMVALVAIAILIPGLSERGLDLQSDLSPGGRIANLPDLLFTLGQFWPLGSGFGTFVPVFKASENLDLMGDLYLNHAHNDLLELLIEGGLPVALLLLAGLFALAVRLWRLLAKGRATDPAIALAGLTIILLAMAHSLVDYPLRMRALAAVAAIALALFVAPTQVQKADATEGRSTLVWAGLMLVGLLLGVQSIRIGLGEAAVRANKGPVAAAVRPQNGWGLALLAERQLDQGQAALAAKTSRAAIERTPLAVVALRTLARSEDKVRGAGAGERAWQAASQLGWRDKQVQVWAALRALANRQADVFAMRADALLRIGDPDELMTRFIRQAVVEPRIRQAFIARLVANPPWRTRFFQAETPPTGPALAGVVAVLGDLGHANTAPTRQELRDAIAGLIAAGRYADAIALDRRFVRRRPDAQSLLDDGGFELEESDYQSRATPFDWAIDPRSAELDQASAGRRIAVFATGSADPALQRFVALPVGRYRLQFAVSGPADTGSSLRFAAECTGSIGMLGSSPQVPLGSAAWQIRGFDFRIPAQCGLLKFTLRRVRPGSSTALIDDVRLLRI